MFIVRTGNGPRSHHGPFKTADEAASWALRHELNFNEWSIIHLTDPSHWDGHAARMDALDKRILNNVMS